MDSFEREATQNGFSRVCGVDEAGRGPLAGPVVGAAVVFTFLPPLHLGIKDSKKLTPKKREVLLVDIYREAVGVGVGYVWPEEIDEVNIHNASLLAMERAIEALSSPRGGRITPDLVLVDGLYKIKSLSVEQDAVVSGDAKSVSIAAASIVAKTARDKLMRAYHDLYPGYNFFKNKGYPTKEHMAALDSLGASPIHRRSFSYGGKRVV